VEKESGVDVVYLVDSFGALYSKTEEFERSMMDFGRVFQMVKSKLARERNLIL